jgi:RimJ/RimL family protein N-acetyltransferase
MDPRSPDYLAKLRQIYDTAALAGDKVSIRRLRASDVDERYVGYFDDAELTRYYSGIRRRFTVESIVKEIDDGLASGNFHMYGIFAQGRCVGCLRIGYMLHDHKISDLVCFLGERALHGTGAAVQALSLGIRLAFETYDFRKLFSGMYEANVASIKAYRKAGWIVEGRLPGHYWVDGKGMDRILVGCYSPKYFSASHIEAVKADERKYWTPGK